MNISQKKFIDFQVGDKESFELVVSEKMIDDFAAVSGDMNPLHVDPDFAAATQFGGRVAHGLLGGALFSRLVGMNLPGQNSLFLKLEMSFKKPILAGMKIVVSGIVKRKVEAVQVIELGLEINNEQQDLLTEGKALVKVLK